MINPNIELKDGQTIIDIIIVFDTISIVEKFEGSKNPDKPTFLGAGSEDLITMVVTKDNALSNQKGNELKVSANTLDIIRWRESSISLNADRQAILYKYQSKEIGLISDPEVIDVTVTEKIPNPNDPTNPNTAKIVNYFWQSTVKRPGHVTYNFQFMIYDGDGNLEGCYSWDPFIEITS